MKPTNEMLNRLAAIVCGWTIGELTAKSPYDSSYALQHNGRKIEPWPDYCTDRNAIHELLTAVRENCKEKQFLIYLEACLALDDTFHTDAVQVVYIMLASPRVQVCAALEALGKWPEEWEYAP